MSPHCICLQVPMAALKYSVDQNDAEAAAEFSQSTIMQTKQR